MKSLITIVFMICAFNIIESQKIIEKNIDYKNQYINIDLKFASQIEINTWDKSTVYFKAIIQSEDGNYLDLFELDIKKNENTTSILADAIPMIETSRKDCLKKYDNRKRYCYNNGDWFEFNYTIYVPKNAKFKVSSINGDLKSKIIEGDFTADLISGDINIAKYTGDLNLKTISGEIDIKMIDADLVAKTIQGNIYADKNLQFISANHLVGQTISGRTANGKNRLRLNTINGNMYLRL